MSNVLDRDFLIDVARGNVSGHKLIQKFGRNEDVDTVIVDINMLDVNYSWLQSASTLEAISTDVNDTAGGSGAQTIMIEGLDASFNEISESLTMLGTSATSATSASFIRVHRAYVVTSGTYSGTGSGSHLGDIKIRLSSAGADQLLISTSPLAVGQTQAARYTIPNGKTGYLIDFTRSVDTSKVADVYFFKRENADDVATPFDAMRIVFMMDGVTDQMSRNRDGLMQKFLQKTDLWTAAVSTSVNAEVEVSFSLLLIDN